MDIIYHLALSSWIGGYMRILESLTSEQRFEGVTALTNLLRYEVQQDSEALYNARVQLALLDSETLQAHVVFRYDYAHDVNAAVQDLGEGAYV